jgi:two-component system, OmpR family, response regulator
MSMLSCLVVEDEPGIGWAIHRLLEHAGVTATVAASGASALEYLRKRRFCMIFLDVKLPDADGFELADAIKRLAPAAPIVMISAYFYPNDPKVRQMLERGVARRFISKPFRHDDIVAAVRELAPSDAQWNRLHSPESTAYGTSARAESAAK